jgi:hypothetical protein
MKTSPKKQTMYTGIIRKIMISKNMAILKINVGGAYEALSAKMP